MDEHTALVSLAVVGAISFIACVITNNLIASAGILTFISGIAVYIVGKGGNEDGGTT